jgi:integrase
MFSRATGSDKAFGAVGVRGTDIPDTEKDQDHPDAGLHAMRHTFLTEAGEYADPFTLQYVAGHDNIKTTMRYVHPRKPAVQKTGRLAAG